MAQEQPESESPEHRICYCVDVSRRKLRAEIERLGLQTVEEVTRHMLATNGCQTCAPAVQALLDEIVVERSAKPR